MTEFLQWKEQEERATNSSYVKHSSSKTYGESEHYYYYCNRTGIYIGKGEGKRQLKTQGSSKINMHCIAHMKAVHNIKTDAVNVQYCATHNTHSIQLAHLRMSEETRNRIALKLQQGITVERILDDIRNSLSSEGIKREHMVTRVDVNNVRLLHNIEGVIKHSNDLSSVCAWAEEMESLDYNPLLLFKQQGEQQPQTMDNIGNIDFLLVLQTEFQRDMLKEFGNNTVCIDSTHGTNQYDFKLITLLVIDEFNEGIPVAWAISNKEDTLTIIEILKGIKDRTCPLAPKWFMSDDAEQFFLRGQRCSGKTRPKSYYAHGT